ncbi:MAG: hypothetical protein JOZ02_06315 [Acidobacteria bacterium]|nr:hypothetical protein [Acidobacteriota bacterium]
MSNRYQEIARGASDAYSGHRFKESALLYEQAYRHAKQFQLQKDAYNAGVWSAICWEYCGNYIRALDLLMELMQTVPADVKVSDRYFLKKHSFLILFASNPDLVKLTSHLTVLETFVAEHADLPLADIPSIRGQILSAQGRYDEALEQAELAWSKYNGYGYIKCGFAAEALEYNLKLGKIPSAKRWYELIVAREREVPSNNIERRECRVLQRQALFLFALWEQDYSEALTQVQELEQQLEGTQAFDWWSTYADYKIRSSLLQQSYGDPLHYQHPARSLLVSRSQRSKDVHSIYNRYRLLIDYRLAALRFAVGIEPIDDYFYTRKQSLPEKLIITSHSALQDRIFHVRRACARALRQAEYLDGSLECEWRQDEIKGRVERLEEIVTTVMR